MTLPVIPEHLVRVLDRLVLGESDIEIAEALRYSPKTVKNLQVQVRQLLGTRNRTETALLWQATRGDYRARPDWQAAQARLIEPGPGTWEHRLKVRITAAHAMYEIEKECK